MLILAQNTDREHRFFYFLLNNTQRLFMRLWCAKGLKNFKPISKLMVALQFSFWTEV